MITHNASLFVVVAIWLAQLLYFVGFIPQIITNYRLKSLGALSDLYLLSFTIGWLAETYYVYLLGLPFAYLVMAPLSTVGICLMVGQRFWYAKRSEMARLSIIYFGITIFTLGLIPLAFWYQETVGQFTGWLASLVWCTYQLPQVAKMFREKSVLGYSLVFSTMIGLAAMLECYAAFSLHLPYQTMLNTIRGMCVYLIICYQFYRFGR